MYGKSGEKDTEVIDAHLARLQKGAVVVNLGCGPNVQHELHNLARMVGHYQFRSTLIFADLDTTRIEEQIWVPGPEGRGDQHERRHGHNGSRKRAR